MWQFICFICVLAAVIVLARNWGSKSAQIDSMNAQARERQNANKVMDSMRNRPINDVRERLQNIDDN